MNSDSISFRVLALFSSADCSVIYIMVLTLFSIIETLFSHNSCAEKLIRPFLCYGIKVESYHQAGMIKSRGSFFVEHKAWGGERTVITKLETRQVTMKQCHCTCVCVCVCVGLYLCTKKSRQCVSRQYHNHRLQPCCSSAGESQLALVALTAACMSVCLVAFLCMRMDVRLLVAALSDQP